MQHIESVQKLTCCIAWSLVKWDVALNWAVAVFLKFSSHCPKVIHGYHPAHCKSRSRTLSKPLSQIYCGLCGCEVAGGKAAFKKESCCLRLPPGKVVSAFFRSLGSKVLVYFLEEQDGRAGHINPSQFSERSFLAVNSLWMWQEMPSEKASTADSEGCASIDSKSSHSLSGSACWERCQSLVHAASVETDIQLH